MNKLLLLFLLGVCAIVFSLDFVSPYLGKMQFTGALFWLISQLVLLSYGAYSVLWLINEAFNKRSRLLLLVLASYLLATVFYTNNIVSLQHETTQQIGCMMHGFAESDWLFRKNCFIGYPARQYLLPALLSVVFGRSLITLQFGGLLYFFIGMTIFVKGVAMFLKKNNALSVIGAITIGVLPFFYFVNQRVFYAEQSNYPFSYALIICGLFFIYFLRKGWIELFVISIALLHTVYIYTPGLALSALATLVSIHLLYQKNISNKQKLWIVLTMIVVYAQFALSLQFRGDIRIIPDTTARSQLNNDLYRSFGNLLHPLGNQAFVSPIFADAFVVLIGYFLLGFAGFELSVVTFWILGSMVIAIMTKGYYLNSIDYRIQRWIVVVPIFLSLFMTYLVSIRSRKYMNFAMYVLLCFFLIMGFRFQMDQYNSMVRSEPNAITFWLWRMVPKSFRNETHTIVVDQNLQEYIGSMGDASMYFFPNAHVNIVNVSCNFPVPNIKRTILIIPYSPYNNLPKL